MKKTYICIVVHEDGDNELTKRELTSKQVDEYLFRGVLSFEADDPDKLQKELLKYGNEPDDIAEALRYILNAEPGESCIVGKV